jgi:hypothetical protein
MKNKSKVFDHFLTFTNLVETQHNKNVKFFVRIIVRNILIKKSQTSQIQKV